MFASLSFLNNNPALSNLALVVTIKYQSKLRCYLWGFFSEKVSNLLIYLSQMFVIETYFRLLIKI